MASPGTSRGHGTSFPGSLLKIIHQQLALRIMSSYALSPSITRLLSATPPTALVSLFCLPVYVVAGPNFLLQALQSASILPKLRGMQPFIKSSAQVRGALLEQHKQKYILQVVVVVVYHT